MSRVLVLGSMLLVAAAGTLHSQVNLLDDPGFALAASGTTTSNSAWLLVANAPDGVNPSATFQEGAVASDPADAGNSFGVWIRSYEGGANPGEPLASVVLSQSVAAIAGGDYTLEFSVRREANFLAGAWTATLTSDGTGGSQQLDLLADVPNDGTWVRRSLQLIGVTPGDQLSVEIEVVDGELAPANPQSAMLDAFDLRGSMEPGVVQVPTMSSAGILLLVLLLAAIGLRSVGQSLQGP